MIPPHRPQPPLVDDGYLVEPGPNVDDRGPRHERPMAPAAKGCAWAVLLVACLVFWALVAFVGLNLAAPRSAPDPTTTSPVVDVRPGSAGPSAPATGASGPELSPTPQAIAVLGGYATWYADPAQPADGLYAAAGPALRDALGDWRGQEVRVQVGRRWTNVVLRDACWCVDRRGRPTLLDVSPAAIAWLEPDYRQLGIVEVRVVWTANGPLPATDAE